MKGTFIYVIIWSFYTEITFSTSSKCLQSWARHGILGIYKRHDIVDHAWSQPKRLLARVWPQRHILGYQVSKKPKWGLSLKKQIYYPVRSSKFPIKEILAFNYEYYYDFFFFKFNIYMQPFRLWQTLISMYMMYTVTIEVPMKLVRMRVLNKLAASHTFG